MEIIMQSLSWRVALAGAALLAGSAAFPSVSQADTFNLTSCHISNSTNTGLACPPAGTVFGTVTVTANPVNPANTDISVSLADSNQFILTGSADDQYFKFNGAPSAASITVATVVSGVTF